MTDDTKRPEPVAKVPVHPTKGPLWANTLAFDNNGDMPNYPVRLLYWAPPDAAERPEPVAWRLRERGTSDWIGSWQNMPVLEWKTEEVEEGFEVEYAYLSPPDASAIRREEREAVLKVLAKIRMEDMGGQNFAWRGGVDTCIAEIRAMGEE